MLSQPVKKNLRKSAQSADSFSGETIPPSVKTAAIYCLSVLSYELL
jgi:hypothetical protein